MDGPDPRISICESFCIVPTDDFTGCRSEYKIALITYKALKTWNPPYLADLLEIQVTSRAVRSSDAPHLVLPRTRTELAKQAFAAAAPVIWNSLPAALCHCQTVLTFKNIYRLTVLTASVT